MYASETLNIRRFDSVAELGRYCKPWIASSKSDWRGGISGQEAADLCVTGDESQVAAAQKLLEQFSVPIETAIYMDMPSVTGCYACVPEALAGEPECMREPQVVGNESAPLHVLVDLTCSAAVTADQMRRRGVAILAMTMALSATRPITLEVMAVMCGERREASGSDEFSIVSAKINTTPLDLATAAYALTHAGMTRQLIYRIETSEYGSKGKWPKFSGSRSHDSPERLNAVRGYLGIDGELLLIPPVMHGNALAISNPEKWVLSQLEQYGAREAMF